MKKLFKSVFVMLAASLCVVSCSDDDAIIGTISFDRKAVYLSKGQTVTLKVNSTSMRENTIYVSKKPDGWDKVLYNAESMMLSITAPDAGNDSAAESGKVVMSGASYDGIVNTSEELYVAIVEKCDLSDKLANSYLISKGNTNYLLDVTHRGDGSVIEGVASVGLVWQSVSGLLNYIQLEEGENGKKYASFLIEGTADVFTEGNAVIAAYDAEGDILWNWHVWVSKYDLAAAESTVLMNGYTMMNRNLGAVKNNVETTDELLRSYGLYYQWGRKEPFIGPKTYNCAYGESAVLYDTKKHRLAINTEKSDETTGTQLYANQHPLTFITTEDKNADWSKESAAGWNAETKSVNDPCPHGWRVAPAKAFDNLHITENIAASTPEEQEELTNKYMKRFAWTLSDGTSESLFVGAGRRVYLNGKIQNQYDESLETRMEMQPWVGYYWSADGEGQTASAFSFWFKHGDVAHSGVQNNRMMGRANAMQVRCVKEE